MTEASFVVGDRVLVPMVVEAIDPKLGLVLARPPGTGEGWAEWFEPGQLVRDLTPAPPTQNPPASD